MDVISNSESALDVLITVHRCHWCVSLTVHLCLQRAFLTVNLRCGCAFPTVHFCRSNAFQQGTSYVDLLYNSAPRTSAKMFFITVFSDVDVTFQKSAPLSQKWFPTVHLMCFSNRAPLTWMCFYNSAPVPGYVFYKSTHLTWKCFSNSAPLPLVFLSASTPLPLIIL